MKKVLIWGMTANWGGIESVLYNYVIHSNKKEIVFDFITTFKSIPREDELKKLGCRVTYIIDRRSNFFEYRKQLRNHMESYAKDYDAVWLNDCMFANIDILKIAKEFGIRKRIIHAHNANSLGGGASRLIRHKINSFLLPLYATDYWACSQHAGEWSFSNKILNCKNYRVIPNAIDCDKYKYNLEIRNEYRNMFSVSDDTLVVGHVGRFDYQKNHDYLLRAFKELLISCPNSLLLSVGVGTDLELIKNKAKQMQIDNKIIFLGQRDDVASIFQAMDIFVLPSQFEGLPVVLVEAMASGLPCLISDKVTKESGIIRELSYFESIETKPSNWSDKIIKIVSSTTRRDTLVEMIAAGFDIKHKAGSIHELF